MAATSKCRNEEAKVSEPNHQRRITGCSGSSQQNAQRARPQAKSRLVEELSDLDSVTEMIDLACAVSRSDRAQLPASADVLELRRRGGRPLWFVGRRLDDAGAALSLPPLRNLGARFRAGIGAGSRALVPALALWPLARHQLRRRGRALARPLSVSPHARRAQALITVRGAAALRGSCTSDKSWHRFAASRRAVPPEGAIPDRPAKLTCIRRQ